MIEGERGHLSEAALPEGVARDVLEAVVREGEHHQASKLAFYFRYQFQSIVSQSDSPFA